MSMGQTYGIKLGPAQGNASEVGRGDGAITTPGEGGGCC